MAKEKRDDLEDTKKEEKLKSANFDDAIQKLEVKISQVKKYEEEKSKADELLETPIPKVE